MSRFRSNDPWRALWTVATSDYLLGGVFLILAVALLLAAWLPQTSAGESPLDVTWQAQVHRRFGEVGWFNILRAPLQTIGAFQIADAVWFRLSLALLAFFLFARLVDGFEDLWKGWRGALPPEGTPWVAVEGEWDELVGRLRARRLHVIERRQQRTSEAQTDAVTDGAADVIRADRWPWGNLGPVFVYLGGLVTLLGVAATALWGWREGPLYLVAGESALVGRKKNFTLQLEELTHDGRHGVGHIWRDGDTLVEAGDLVVGRPLVGGGVGAYLVDSGAGLKVRATLSDTQVLELATGVDREGQEELVLTFSDEEPSHLVGVGVPEADLVLLLTMPIPVRIGTFPRIQVFESGSGELIVEHDTLVDTNLKIDGVSFTLTPTSYAKVRVICDPGAFWTQLGVVSLIIGAVLWRLWPPRRLWLHRAAQSQGQLVAVGDMSLLSVSGSASTQANSGKV